MEAPSDLGRFLRPHAPRIFHRMLCDGALLSYRSQLQKQLVTTCASNAQSNVFAEPRWCGLEPEWQRYGRSILLIIYNQAILLACSVCLIQHHEKNTIMHHADSHIAMYRCIYIDRYIYICIYIYIYIRTHPPNAPTLSSSSSSLSSLELGDTHVYEP